MSYDDTINETTQLVKEIEKMENEIKKLPKGKLLIFKNNNRMRYFWKIKNEPRKCVSSSNEEFIADLALKTYYDAKIIDLKNIINSNVLFINNFKKTNKAEEFLTKSKRVRQLIEKKISNYTDDEIDFINNLPRNKDYFTDDLIIKTTTGEYVRNKSEMMIYEELLAKNILFVYERRYFDFLPDFIIIHPITKEIIIWEHFGRMEAPEMIMKRIRKITDYYNRGFILGKNLIITVETDKNPLDIVKVRNTIDDLLRLR